METDWKKFEHCIITKQFKQALILLETKPNKIVKPMMADFFEADVRRSQAYGHFFELLEKKQIILLQSYYTEWFKLLNTSSHAAFLRNSFRFFQYVDVPEEHEGVLFEIAFNYFMDPKKAIAIRVFAMTTCYNIAKQYPELLREVKEAILSLQKENLSAGMRSRSSHLLKKIGS